MKSKLQSGIWIFAGICFLLGIIISAFDGSPFGAYYVLSVFTCIMSFINAYIVYKRAKG